MNQRGHSISARGAAARFLSALAVGALTLRSTSTWACSVCYGQSDSPMAAGMNWGILFLLGMIVFVLGGVAGFFIFLARRSALLAASQPDLAEPSSHAAVRFAQPAKGRVGLGQAAFLPHPRHRCAENRAVSARQRN